MTPMRAMIMAAGLGTRMQPLTFDRPKPLIEVAGKALIDHVIDRLAAAGVRLIVVNMHYQAGMLRDHLAARRDVEIRFSLESDELLGTGGGVVRALAHFEDEPFFIHNSDSIWIEQPGKKAGALEIMKARWRPDAMDGLLLLADRASALGYDGTGDFCMDGEGLLSRVPRGGASPFAYPGVQIVHPHLFADAPKGAFSTNLMWDRAIARRRLLGTPLGGVWMHIGTPAARGEAEALLAARTPA